MKNYNNFTVRDMHGNIVCKSVSSEVAGKAIGCTGANVCYHNKNATKPFNIKGYTVSSKSYGGINNKAKVKVRGDMSNGRTYKSTKAVYTLVSDTGEVTERLTRTEISKLTDSHVSYLYQKGKKQGYPFTIKGNVVYLAKDFSNNVTSTQGKTIDAPQKSRALNPTYTIVNPNGNVREKMTQLEATQVLKTLGYSGVIPQGKLALPFHYNGFVVHDSTVYDGSYLCSPPPVEFKPKNDKSKKQKVKVQVDRKPNEVETNSRVEPNTVPEKLSTSVVDDEVILRDKPSVIDNNGLSVIKDGKTLFATQNIASVSKLSKCPIDVLHTHIISVGLPISVNGCDIYDSVSFNANMKAGKSQPDTIEVLDRILGDYTIVDDVHGIKFSNLTQTDLASYGIDVSLLSDMIDKYGYPVGLFGYTIFDNETYNDWYGDETPETSPESSKLDDNNTEDVKVGFWKKLFK